MGIPDDATGVFASQHLEEAIRQGWIRDADDNSVQPASLDLHLGSVAFRMRCSFLPGQDSVENRLKGVAMDALDLDGEGAILETNRPYLIPLRETVALPPHVRARTNPKSSTGRLDVFTRVITDGGAQFDEVAEGYKGRLWLEVVPLSFTVRVREGLPLNQLRLLTGDNISLGEDELKALHRDNPILYQGGLAVPERALRISGGLFLGLDLEGDANGRVGHEAKRDTPLVDMAHDRGHYPDEYWNAVVREQGDRIVLGRGIFYLLLSDEAVRIPPNLAAEMTAYDPTAGELRTHYAGFFDPGFGYDASGDLRGSRAALEVRAHDVPFMVEHRQPVCKLTFERMVEPPDRLYGSGIGSNYQGQVETLGKHFCAFGEEPKPYPVIDPVQGRLFA
jgi:dCTP deaminase